MKHARPKTSPLSSRASARSEDSEGFGAKWMDSLWRAAGQVFYRCGPAGMTFRGDVNRLLGLSKAGLEGGRREWLRRIHPDDLAPVTAMEAAAVEGKPHLLEYRFSRADGSVVYLRDTSCPIRDPESGVLYPAGMLEDVSETRRMAADLRHFQKMRAFGELAGGVAHDFNNLLTLFQGYTEMLQMAAAPGDPSMQYLNEMAAAVERARELTSQLHRFNRRKPGVPEATELSRLLLEFRKMLRRLMGEAIELALSLETQSGWVMADPLQIETLLVNLVVNACEAMPRGGRLGVELAEVRIAPRDRRVRLDGWRPGSYVRLTVSDTGEGISKPHLKRIFEPGFTTRTRESAEGLGLSTCREIVRQYGGQLTVQSAPGKGSAFAVFLPATAPPARKAPAAAPGPLPSGKGEQILIVEDDAPVRRALAAMVRRWGYKVCSAPNGSVAQRILQKEHKIRLVITDLVMPIMGGVELAEVIRRRWPAIRIILTSGYPFQPPEKTELTSHLSTFLPKPLNPGVLAHQIRKILDV